MTESSEEIPANLPIFLPALQGWQGHIHHKAKTRGHESKAIQPTRLPAQNRARCPEEQLVALRHAAIVRRVPMEKAAARTETGSKFRRSEMKKNRVLAMTLAVVTAGSLAACGSTNTAGVQSTAATEETVESSAAASSASADAAAADSSAASDAAQDTSDDGRTVINFWHSMSGANEEYLNTMIDTYNQGQDKYKVVGTFQGDYYSSAAKVVTDIANGTGPDLIQMGSGQVVILSQDDVTENLLPYMTEDSGVTYDDFYPGFIQDYYDEAGQKLNALPMGCSTPVLYVNTDILKKAGLEVPKTWEEMKDTCQKLKDGGYCDFGFTQPRDAWYFWMMIETYGGPVFSDDNLSLACADNGTLDESFGLLLDMIKADTFRPGPQSDSSNTMQGWFTGGQCAFLINSIGALSGVRAACEESGVNMEVAQIPGHEIDGTIHYAVPYGGNTMVMLKSSENKDGAWDFMKFMYTNDAGVATFDYNTGYLACSNTIMNTSIMQKKATEDADWARANGYVDYVVTDYLIEAVGDVAQDITEFMDAVFYDQEDPHTAIEEQLPDINEILKEHEGRS